VPRAARPSRSRLTSTPCWPRRRGPWQARCRAGDQRLVIGVGVESRTRTPGAGQAPARPASPGVGGGPPAESQVGDQAHRARRAPSADRHADPRAWTRVCCSSSLTQRRGEPAARVCEWVRRRVAGETDAEGQDDPCPDGHEEGDSCGVVVVSSPAPSASASVSRRRRSCMITRRVCRKAVSPGRQNGQPTSPAPRQPDGDGWRPS